MQKDGNTRHIICVGDNSLFVAMHKHIADCNKCVTKQNYTEFQTSNWKRACGMDRMLI